METSRERRVTLAEGLCAWARGSYGPEASAGLLIAHGEWLRRQDFVDGFVEWSDDGRLAAPLLGEAVAAMDAGRPSGSQRPVPPLSSTPVNPQAASTLRARSCCSGRVKSSKFGFHWLIA